MKDSSIPGKSPDEGMHKKDADEKPGDERKNDAVNHIGPPDGDDGENPKTTLLLFSVITALIIVFWLLAEFVDKHGHFNLYALFFWLAIICALLGVVEGVEKTIGCPRWGWVVYFVVCAGLIPFVYIGSRPLSERPIAQIDKWQPPELPKGCTTVHVHFGDGSGLALPVDGLKKGWWAPQTFGLLVTDAQGTRYISGFKPFFLVASNRFYVRLPLPLELSTNQVSILMDNHLDETIPAEWDRNYNSNAFEIVGEDNLPLLQVLYKRPDTLEINGIFAVSNGVCIIFGKGRVPMFSTEIPNDIPDRKPLFRYPSSLHLHELAPPSSDEYVRKHPLPEQPPAPLVERPEDPYSGVLEPANDALPFAAGRSAADFPSNSVFLFAGSLEVTFGQSRHPCIVAYNEDCILTIEEEEGEAFLSGKFFDDEGRLVTRLIRNKFEAAMPPVTFRVYRPNKSTLIVHDSRGEEILNLKYLARSAFEMTGIIRLPHRGKMTITSDAVRLPDGGELHGGGIQAISAGGTATAFALSGPPMP